MTLVTVLTVDHLADARSRVTEAFKDRDIFDRYIQLLVAQQTELEQVFTDLIQKRSIDEATGATLDIIGDIVGQARKLISVDIYNYFGFMGAPNAGGFGEWGSNLVGSKLYSNGSPLSGNVLLDDETYRLFIKAKIAKNVTSATPEDIMSFVNYIFGAVSSTIQLEGKAAYTLMIGKKLTSLEKALLNYVDTSDNMKSYFMPKPIGVRVGYGDYNGESFFAFDEVPNAKGFGDFNQQYYDGTATYDGDMNYLPSIKVGVGGEMASLITNVQ